MITNLERPKASRQKIKRCENEFANVKFGQVMSNNNNDSNLTFGVVENWLPAQMHKEYMFIVSPLSQKTESKSMKHCRREKVVVFELEVKFRLHGGNGGC